MDKDDVLERFCVISSKVREVLTDQLGGKEPYSYAADCFCNDPSEVTRELRSSLFVGDFVFDEEVMEFIETAVNKHLNAHRTATV